MSSSYSGLGQVISWWICTFAAFVFIIPRVIVRYNRFGRLYLDDYFIILAFCCLVGDLAIQQHMWNLGMSDIASASRSEFIGIMQMIVPGSTLYVSSLWAIKLSLVIFYKRLAARTTFQLAYNVTAVFIIITWIGLVLFDVFECFPIRRKWTLNSAETCSVTVESVNYWMTILLNIFSDIFIMALPISMVLKMKLPMKQKLAIVGVFCLGFGVVVASIIRAYYSHRNETMLTCTVSMIETSVSIIATCLPTLRSLVFRSKTQTSTPGRYPGNGRHYELSSSKHGVTKTRIAGGTKVKSRISTPVGNNNWPYAGERGTSRTVKTTNDSDESLFRPIGTDKSTASSKITEMDPRTLGVLPDVESDSFRMDTSPEAGKKMGGITVTTAYQVTESNLI